MIYINIIFSNMATLSAKNLELLAALGRRMAFGKGDLKLNAIIVCTCSIIITAAFIDIDLYPF